MSAFASSDRAEKSGIALEAQQKIYEKYDKNLAGEILQWVQDITGQSFDTQGDADNFVKVFQDGSVLCNLANALKPGSVKKVNTSTMAFKKMENISFFLKFAEEFVQKSELFQTVDLYEGQDPNAVLICLASLARKSEKNFGRSGLGPKEAQGDRREWTDEQLKAGQNVIGLQMGSNKGATASGLNMGNTRHM
ncbi:CBN-CPN-1 protein [Caenorhabditis brenneri]|uniref:CBN-CPN-1 protein n=1 Tax=Caenorhabditis brenneri TaxID=135651 RepID=G0PFY0_CAEBE|nr:CBN-CPN-1 protein [Caenorhabditis brenneri]